MIRVVLHEHYRLGVVTTPRTPAQVFMLAIGGSNQLCVSGSVYAKYEEVISRPRFQLSEEIMAGALRIIRHRLLGPA